MPTKSTAHIESGHLLKRWIKLGLIPSYAVATKAAAILSRMTGDETGVVENYGKFEIIRWTGSEWKRG